MRAGRYVYAGAIVLALIVAFGLWKPIHVKADRGSNPQPPRYRVDASWPKPLPAPNGHQWVTGEVGGSCIDSQNHLITVNRSWQSNFSTTPPGKNQLFGQEGDTSIPAPPVIEYDRDGNVVNAWGDTSKDANGAASVLPQGIHGCFVDYQDNVWIAGNGDGVVQKWTHDGKTMLLQIGTKGLCDGPPGIGGAPFTTCGNTASVFPTFGTSHTLLNEPADLAVDPNPDPVTGKAGDVYIADGYGNHRIIVFDSSGNYLRQWGSPGSGPGQYTIGDGGHPHCVVLGNDGLVYTCDRGQNRFEVFDKLGNLKRIIPVVDASTPAFATLPGHTPATALLGTNRACDIDFSADKGQNFIFDTDLGNDVVWIIDKALGQVVSHIGGAGHNCGEFTFAHTVTADSNGILYVAETINGRRVQKFVPVGNANPRQP